MMRDENTADDIDREVKGQKTPGIGVYLLVGLLLIVIVLWAVPYFKKKAEIAAREKWLESPVLGNIQLVISEDTVLTPLGDRVNIWRTLEALVGKEPEGTPQPRVAGVYHYDGSWNTILARGGVPTGTRSMIATGMVTASRSEGLEESDIIAEVFPEGGNIRVVVNQPDQWPCGSFIGNVLYADTGASMHRSCGMLNCQNLVLESMQRSMIAEQLGRSPSEVPLADASVHVGDFGSVIKIDDMDGTLIWELGRPTEQILADGSLELSGPIDGTSVRVVRGVLNEGIEYERWWVTNQGGYEMLVIHPSDEGPPIAMILMSANNKLIFAEVNQAATSGATYASWIPGQGPSLASAQDWQEAVADYEAVRFVYDSEGVFHVALNEDGSEMRIGDILSSELGNCLDLTDQEINR